MFPKPKSEAVVQAQTSFDHVVAALGIGPSEYKDSAQLKEWVRRNKDEKYVPTDLLKHWGFAEDEEAA